MSTNAIFITLAIFFLIIFLWCLLEIILELRSVKKEGRNIENDELANNTLKNKGGCGCVSLIVFILLCMLLFYIY